MGWMDPKSKSMMDSIESSNPWSTDIRIITNELRAQDDSIKNLRLEVIENLNRLRELESVVKKQSSKIEELEGEIKILKLHQCTLCVKH